MAYPATFLSLQDAVIDKLRLDAAEDRERVKDWINQIYADACIETQASITAATMVLTANEPTYTLPAALIRITDIFVSPVSGTQYGPLEPVTLAQILRWRTGQGGANTTSGSVTHYCRRGINLVDFYPTPSSADTLTVYYVERPTSLSQDADTPELPEPYASKVLEYGALAEGADFKMDPREQEYRGLYQDWLRRLQVHLNVAGGGVAKQIPVYGSVSPLAFDNSVDVR